jgi:hypothetical protein
MGLASIYTQGPRLTEAGALLVPGYGSKGSAELAGLHTLPERVPLAGSEAQHGPGLVLAVPDGGPAVGEVCDLDTVVTRSGERRLAPRELRIASIHDASPI